MNSLFCPQKSVKYFFVVQVLGLEFGLRKLIEFLRGGVVVQTVQNEFRLLAEMKVQNRFKNVIVVYCAYFSSKRLSVSEGLTRKLKLQLVLVLFILLVNLELGLLTSQLVPHRIHSQMLSKILICHFILLFND
jgi:hypothetical protein